MKKLLSYVLIGAFSLSIGTLVSCEKEKPTPKFAINVTAAENGNTITATLNDQPVVEAKEGETITLTATSTSGYTFTKWIVSSNVTLIGEETALSVTFKMPASDVTIDSEFEEEAVIPETYAINITPAENGNAIEATIDGQPVTEAEEGETITLTATPASDYTFTQWVVSSNVTLIGEETALSVTFEMPASDVTISAEFEEVVIPNPNYIQINDGERQEILASAYTFVEGEGYGFSLSPMNLTDRPVSVMEKRLDFFIPVELMNTAIDMATTPVSGSGWNWFLVVDLQNAFLDRKVFENNYSTTGNIKVALGAEAGSFVIDFTNFKFRDGTILNLHYEGTIADKVDFDDILRYTATLATWDIQFGDETINTQTIGYVQSKVALESDGTTMCTNFWSYIDEPYCFYDIYLSDPDGGTFTEGTYSDGISTPLYFEGAYETDNALDFFGGEGTISVSKTATTITITYNDVFNWDQGNTINGTITYDVAAPLTYAAPAFIPNKAKKFSIK